MPAHAPPRDLGATPPSPRSARLRALVVALARLYGVLLLAVLAIRFGLRDRAAWSFAVSSLLPYAFLPAPLLPIAAWLGRRRELYALVAVAWLVPVWLWGRLFIPLPAPPHAPQPTLTVAAYNVLGFNLDTRATVDVVAALDADVVALQELNPENAAALERELGERYPHRWLEPRVGVTGGGLLCRYPFKRLGLGPVAQVPWVGEPMAIELQIVERTVTLLRFHAFAGPGRVEEREQQAKALAAFAATIAGPLVLTGDLNATDQSTAYATITAATRDAWRDAGWGFGHTFPGRKTAKEGGSRPVLLGVPVPMWLVRIDYVFHSDGLVPLTAQTGPSDGPSDHRPVVATLAFR